MSDSEPHPLQLPPSTGEARIDALRRLLLIVDRLRAADGCPWDLEQTVDSMAPSLVEEAHELVEAIETENDASVVEEAGDLLMVILLISRIAEDGGRFDIGRAARAVGDKLIRRHPHVFGGEDVTGAAHVVRNWERIKADERRERREDASALAGVPRAMPALQRAHRVGAKAIAAGFRWQDAEGALAKLEEEIGELREAFAAARGSDDEGARRRLGEELGDVLLAAAFLGDYVEIDPERATRDALRRFEARFRVMEIDLGDRLRDAPLEELLAAWDRAKAAVSDPGAGER